jgi:hypothetical protein
LLVISVVLVLSPFVIGISLEDNSFDNAFMASVVCFISELIFATLAPAAANAGIKPVVVFASSL